MKQKSLARVATLSFVGLAAAIAVSTPTKADDVKMGYINKMGEHPWFVSEVAGAKAEAGKLGVNLMTQDVQFDANLALTTFDTMVGDGVKAIAIVVPDKALGPVVAEKAPATLAPTVTAAPVPTAKVRPPASAALVTVVL